MSVEWCYSRPAMPSGSTLTLSIGAESYDNALTWGYREDEGLYLESDADEQLLIYIPCTLVIKLHSIVIEGSEQDGPRLVKLFANKEHMGLRENL